MNGGQKFALFILRVSMGWVMFYAGITKILNPAWSAAGYLGSAKTFPAFYQWFLQPNILPTINFINEWGADFAWRVVNFGYRSQVFLDFRRLADASLLLSGFDLSLYRPEFIYY